MHELEDQGFGSVEEGSAGRLGMTLTALVLFDPLVLLESRCIGGLRGLWGLGAKVRPCSQV